jgi:tetratricopeptide repeat protein 30
MLALCENLVKQTIVVRDSVLHECIQFLTHCEQHGRDVKAVVDGPLADGTMTDKNSVMYC